MIEDRRRAKEVETQVSNNGQSLSRLTWSISTADSRAGPPLKTPQWFTQQLLINTSLLSVNKSLKPRTAALHHLQHKQTHQHLTHLQTINCTKHGRSTCDIGGVCSVILLRAFELRHLGFKWECTFYIWRRGGNSTSQPNEDLLTELKATKLRLIS